MVFGPKEHIMQGFGATLSVGVLGMEPAREIH